MDKNAYCSVTETASPNIIYNCFVTEEFTDLLYNHRSQMSHNLSGTESTHYA